MLGIEFDFRRPLTSEITLHFFFRRKQRTLYESGIILGKYIIFSVLMFAPTLTLGE